MRVRILGRDVDMPCASGREQRLSDLAAQLNARLGDSGEADDVTRLAQAALALMDEAQLAHAALERARLEVERLTDLVVEARTASDSQAVVDDRRPARRPSPYAAQGSA